MSSSSVALKSIAKIKGGKRLPKGSSLQTHKNSHPYLRIVDMGAKNISKLNLQYVPDEVFPKISRYITNTDDVLLSIVGTIGLVSIVDEELDNASLTENCVKVTLTDKNFSPEFLYYYLSSDVGQHEIKIRQVGSTQPKLPLYNIEQIPVPALPHEKQIFIAKILGDLDRKIELNRRMNETLEQIGQTLFKHYFIDNPEHEGWKETTFGEHFQLERGLSYKGMFLDEKEGVPMINLGSFNVSGEYSPRGIKYYTGEYKDKNTVKPGDLVMANTDITQQRTVLGSVLVVPDLGEEILYSHHVNAIRSKGAIPNSFVYFALKQPAFRQRAQGFATGTTVLALPKEAFTECSFCMPDEDLLSKFADVANNLLKEKELLRKEIITLSNLRDFVLPKLMSGRIKF